MVKWRLFFKTLPVVLIIAVGKIVVEKFFGFKGVIDWADIAPVLTAGVFLVGLMVSGTMADFKESEKLPADLACSLEVMEETIDWAAHSKPALNTKSLKQLLAQVTQELIDWLYRKRSHEQSFQSIERLNKIVFEMDVAGATNPASKMVDHVHTLRRIVSRIGVISRTSFLSSGYALLDILVGSIVLLLFFVNFKGKDTYDKLVMLIFVPLTYVYMWFLVRDLDDPFEYSATNSKGAAEVELFPLLEYQKRSQARLGNPSTPAS